MRAWGAASPGSTQPNGRTRDEAREFPVGSLRSGWRCSGMRPADRSHNLDAGADSVELVEEVHKLAVLRANAIGDYLVSLPAIEALRSAYPAAELVLLGAGWHASFLAGRPGP